VVGVAWRDSSESTTSSFTTYALCIKGPLTYVQHSKTLAGDDSHHTVKATCPSGTKATGGGIKLGDPDNDYMVGTYPPGAAGWVGAAWRASSLGSDATFTAWVVCAPSGHITVKSKSFSLPDDNKAHVGTVNCGTAGNVTGGGIKLGDPDNDSEEGTYPAGKSGWNGIAARGGTGANTFTVYAVCVK